MRNVVAHKKERASRENVPLVNALSSDDEQTVLEDQPVAVAPAPELSAPVKGARERRLEIRRTIIERTPPELGARNQLDLNESARSGAFAQLAALGVPEVQAGNLLGDARVPPETPLPSMQIRIDRDEPPERWKSNRVEPLSRKERELLRELLERDPDALDPRRMPSASEARDRLDGDRESRSKAPVDDLARVVIPSPGREPASRVGLEL
jgi:hypothetical protein